MLILRILAPLVALFLAGLGIAWAVTRNRRYLRLAGRTALAALVLAVGFGLLYVFERVLLL